MTLSIFRAWKLTVLFSIWAAIKRECLMVMAEGVSTPEQIDKAWMEILGCNFGPCMSMDSKSFILCALRQRENRQGEARETDCSIL